MDNVLTCGYAYDLLLASNFMQVMAFDTTNHENWGIGSAIGTNAKFLRKGYIVRLGGKPP